MIESQTKYSYFSLRPTLLFQKIENKQEQASEKYQHEPLTKPSFPNSLFKILVRG